MKDKKSSAKTLTIRQYRSGASRPRRQRRVLRSLGLRRLNHTREIPDTPSVRGMLNAIPHLVEVVVETAKKSRPAAGKTATESGAQGSDQ